MRYLEQTFRCRKYYGGCQRDGGSGKGNREFLSRYKVTVTQDKF